MNTKNCYYEIDRVVWSLMCYNGKHAVFSQPGSMLGPVSFCMVDPHQYVANYQCQLSLPSL